MCLSLSSSRPNSPISLNETSCPETSSLDAILSPIMNPFLSDSHLFKRLLESNRYSTDESLSLMHSVLEKWTMTYQRDDLPKKLPQNILSVAKEILAPDTIPKFVPRRPKHTGRTYS